MKGSSQLDKTTTSVHQMDGMSDESTSSSERSASPSPPSGSPVHEQQNAPQFSRSNSPATVAGPDLMVRTSSPLSLGYPYHHVMHGGFSYDPPTAAVIRG